MAFVSNLLSVSEPNGVWETIIKAFEAGVGSYILAIVLITLIIKIIWAPFETINKKINKKNMRIQAKMQPELEKIKAKYGADKNLLNQKTQELYKKNKFSMMGSCVFMLVFLALNLTIFFTLFSGINAMADYKISQEYDYLKYNYANVLQLTNEEYEEGDMRIFENYENVTFQIRDAKEGEQAGQKYLVALLNEEEIGSVVFKTDFSYQTDEVLKNENGEDVLDEEGKPVYKIVTSDEVIQSWVYKFVTQQEGENAAYFAGQEQLTSADVATEQQTNKKTAVETYSSQYIKMCYENSENKSSFLWIANYWIADSPFKNSIFTYDQFKSEIGQNNVSAQEETIYNAFMPKLSEQVGRTNGYFILAILSIGLSFLAIWVGNLTGGKKKDMMPKQTGAKVMMFVLPIIMGIFAIFYNSVFAIYMVVSQAISAALAPLENLIVNKWEQHQEKKEEEKKKSVVDYRRK